MKNLKITDYQHDRIKSGAEKQGLPVGSFSDAILDYALSKYEAGDVQMTAPVPPRIEEAQPQPEEAAV